MPKLTTSPLKNGLKESHIPPCIAYIGVMFSGGREGRGVGWIKITTRQDTFLVAPKSTLVPTHAQQADVFILGIDVWVAQLRLLDPGFDNGRKLPSRLELAREPPLSRRSPSLDTAVVMRSTEAPLRRYETFRFLLALVFPFARNLVVGCRMRCHKRGCE